MALTTLAQFVKNLTVPNPAGLDSRKLFNTSDFKKYLGAGASTPTLVGDDLKAFLTFQKGDIATRILQGISAVDPDLQSVDAQDFFIWYLDFIRWDFPPGEEKEYSGAEPPAGPKAQYGGPHCQIHKVIATAGAPYTIDVYVEGALAGCAIELRDNANKVVPTTPVVVDGNSTFRFGHLTTTATLNAGQKYNLFVVDDLGGQIFRIGGGPGEFVAP